MTRSTVHAYGCCALGSKILTCMYFFALKLYLDTEMVQVHACTELMSRLKPLVEESSEEESNVHCRTNARACGSFHGA
jgi:hypothetical protein